MSSSPVVTLDDVSLSLVDELAALQERREHIEKQETEVKSKLRELLTVGTIGADGDGVRRVSMRPNRRFSRELATQVLPDPLLALCTISIVDSATARKALPPRLYESCQSEGEPSVVLL